MPTASSEIKIRRNETRSRALANDYANFFTELQNIQNHLATALS